MILLAALLSSAPEPLANAGRTAPVRAHAAIGRESFCTASDGTRIAYVDWGGTGPAVVLIAGLGNSARIFDDLAPRLAHRHRVIAITRRGYGASGDARAGDYGNARLVADILDVMDGLNVRRASFVGHSLAGGELAALGADHADRVRRLIYLDAAYDRSVVPALMAALPTIPGPTPQDRANPDAMARWRAGALGVASPAIRSDIVATMRAGPDGLLPRTSQETAAVILKGDMASPPRYAAIAAPSLALYTSKDVAEQVPASASDQTREAVTAYSIAHIRPWMLQEKARFEARQRCGVAFEVPHSGHYLFLERPAWVSRVVMDYLASSHPCSFKVAQPPDRSTSGLPR